MKSGIISFDVNANGFLRRPGLGKHVPQQRPPDAVAALACQQRDVDNANLGVAAVQGTYYVSIALLGVGLAILIQYLAPTLIVVLDVVRGRRVPRWTWIGIAGALAVLRAYQRRG